LVLKRISLKKKKSLEIKKNWREINSKTAEIRENIKETWCFKRGL